MEQIITFDQSLFHLINQAGNPFLDKVMYEASNKFFFVPLYVVIAAVLIRIYRFQSILFFVVIGLMIFWVDQTTSSLMKPYFGRLRPCHDPLMQEMVRLVAGCGGKYGFISGHAANTFALAAFFRPAFKKPFVIALFIWAAIVSYSRIYLGVHFPLDVLFGGLYGVTCGWIFSIAHHRTHHRIFKPL